MFIRSLYTSIRVYWAQTLNYEQSAQKFSTFLKKGKKSPLVRTVYKRALFSRTQLKGHIFLHMIHRCDRTVWSIIINSLASHYVNIFCIRGCSGPLFPAFGLNTERYGVSHRIQSKCGQIKTRIIQNTDTFHVVWFV